MTNPLHALAARLLTGTTLTPSTLADNISDPATLTDDLGTDRANALVDGWAAGDHR